MVQTFPFASQFFVTPPSDCPYIDGREEQKVFTYLAGREAPQVHQNLAELGFRRSQTLLYKPVCQQCSACRSVRVKVADFEPSRRMRRVFHRNKDISSEIAAPKVTDAHFDLFQSYVGARHAEGGMADMDRNELELMVEDSPVETLLINYYLNASDGERQLIGTALTDQMSDGYSMVYSFFRTDMAKRSLGSFMILDHISRARDLGLDHIYLGYWIEQVGNMAYKSIFQPLEVLNSDNVWMPFDAVEK